MLCALWTSAFAQGKPSLQVVVENPGRYARICGIQEASLESIATLTLRNNGIQVPSSSTNPFLHLSVNLQTVETGAETLGCAANVHVTVRYIAPGKPLYGGFKSRHGSTIELCEHGTLITASPSDIWRMVSRSVEEQVKLCLGSLEY
jgi:hypothetical protein